MIHSTRYKICIVLGVILGFLTLFSVVNAQEAIIYPKFSTFFASDEINQSVITEFLLNCQDDNASLGNRYNTYNEQCFIGDLRAEFGANQFGLPITSDLYAYVWYANDNDDGVGISLQTDTGGISLGSNFSDTWVADSVNYADEQYIQKISIDSLTNGDFLEFFQVSDQLGIFDTINPIALAISYDDLSLSSISNHQQALQFFDSFQTLINANPSIYNVDIIKPVFATTTNSTTVEYEINYSVLASFDPIPAGEFGFHIRDAVTNQIEIVDLTPFQANTAFNVTLTGTTSATIGSKYIRAFIQDTNGVDLATFDDVFFNVATNTFKSATGLDNPNESGADLTQIDCDLFDVGCQFQKALTFLFYPNQNSLDRFANIWQRLTNVVPFGYVTVTINQLKSLDDNAVPAFEWPQLPFVNTIFDPMRTAISGIMWALFGIYFFMHRLRHLDL